MIEAMKYAVPSGVAPGALVERVITNHRRPPLLPALLELDIEDRFAPQRLAELMERDPLMSRRVYESNLADGSSLSAAFTARDAIQRSGVAGVHFTVTVCGIAHSLEASARPGFRPFWHHAIAASLIASLMGAALRTGYIEAAVTSLLTSAGRLLLALHEPTVERLTRERAEATRQPLNDIERLHLGCSSVELGHQLARAWELPEAIAGALDDAEADPVTLAGIAQRSRRSAIRYGYSNPLEPSGDPNVLPTDEHVQNVLRKWGGPEELDAALARVSRAAQLVE